jgi:hypothetical protein
MVKDAETGHFKTFTFSWRHPITWWFIINIFARIGVLIVCTFLVGQWLVVGSNAIKQQFLITFVLIFALFVHFLVIGFAHFIAMKYSHLQRAYKWLQEVSLHLQLLRCSSVHCNNQENKNSLRRLLIIGYFFIVIFVSNLIFKLMSFLNNKQI